MFSFMANPNYVPGGVHNFWTLAPEGNDGQPHIQTMPEGGMEASSGRGGLLMAFCASFIGEQGREQSREQSKESQREGWYWEKYNFPEFYLTCRQLNKSYWTGWYKIDMYRPIYIDLNYP